MKLADLRARQPVATARLAGETILHRIQLSAPRPTSTVVGPVIMAPPGLLACRYDLPATAVAYFTFAETTALYETWARRESLSIPLTEIAKRELLSVVLNPTGLNVADLRPHVSDWPAMQSMRYAPTQELADDLARHNYDGAVYHSAQQFAQASLVLFGSAVARVTRTGADPLYDTATARLHRCVVDAARGAALPLVP
jgi:hypothetical protein